MIYLAFISLGLPDSLLGSAWPIMHTDLDTPVSFAGIIIFIISIGTILASLQADRATKKFGSGLVTTFSVAITALALFGFSSADSFLLLCLWSIPYGLGAGAVDATLNNYVALHFAARHMSWLHCFWGVGASCGPFIMGYALNDSQSWTQGYWIVAVIQTVLLVIIFSSLPLWNAVRKNKTHKNEQTAHDQQAMSLFQTVRIPGVPLVLAVFFGYCAFETTAIVWASSYLAEWKGISTAIASGLAAIFLLGMTGGRFLTGFVADWWGDKWIIRGGLLLALLGAILVAVPVQTDMFALSGLVLAGLGGAPIYPAIIHSAPQNFGTENSQSVIGVQMAVAYLGSILMPPLFGILADRVTMGIFPYYLICIIGISLFISERFNYAFALGNAN